MNARCFLSYLYFLINEGKTFFDYVLAKITYNGVLDLEREKYALFSLRFLEKVHCRELKYSLKNSLKSLRFNPDF